MQLALPFSDRPFADSSVFITDPLYTLPLLTGAGWALPSRGSTRGLTNNAAGLLLSAAYLVWSVAAQAHVERAAQERCRAAQAAAHGSFFPARSPFPSGGGSV